MELCFYYFVSLNLPNTPLHVYSCFADLPARLYFYRCVLRFTPHTIVRDVYESSGNKFFLNSGSTNTFQ